MLSLQTFLDELDHTVRRDTPVEIIEALTPFLEKACLEGIDLPERCFNCESDRYARHLIHIPDDRVYSVVAMTWGKGQKGPLHDHAGSWCVDGVVEGKIRVVSYDHTGTSESGGEIFEEVENVLAGKGEVGHLIPPFEYHTIENPSPDEIAVTLHVYEGEIVQSSAFLPRGDGTYRKEIHPSYYTSTGTE